MSHTLSILPAIFGLIGTLVGAGISGLITYLVAVRRERIDRERESRTRAAEVMRGARLIEGDLGHAAVGLGHALDSNRWWDVELQPLPTGAWEQYCGVIAPEVSYDDWISIWVAVQAIYYLKTFERLTRGLPENKDIRAPIITEGAREVITRALTEIKQGRLALHSLDVREANNKRT